MKVSINIVKGYEDYFETKLKEFLNSGYIESYSIEKKKYVNYDIVGKEIISSIGENGEVVEVLKEGSDIFFLIRNQDNDLVKVDSNLILEVK